MRPLPQKKLILASDSTYRRKQLLQLRLDFTCSGANIDESIQPDESAQEAAIRLAFDKAHSVARNEEQAVVIGADQTAALGNAILGKPGSRERAIAQLKASNQQVVFFFSGICVIDTCTQTVLRDCVTTKVQFRKLSDQQIHNYVETEMPFDCAGSFKCEGLGIALFKSITSDDPSALIGLPLIRLTSFLNEVGIDVLAIEK